MSSDDLRLPCSQEAQVVPSSACEQCYSLAVLSLNTLLVSIFMVSCKAVYQLGGRSQVCLSWNSSLPLQVAFRSHNISHKLLGILLQKESKAFSKIFTMLIPEKISSGYIQGVCRCVRVMCVCFPLQHI